MLIKEYLAHQLIGTPLEKPAVKLRDFTKILKHRKYPELQEIYVESTRAELAMSKIINSSMNCIDIGTHLGSVLSLINKLSPHGKHIAIEPIPYKYNWLKSKFQNVEIIQAALGESNGEVDFYLQSPSSGYSGLQHHGSRNGKQNFKIIKVKCLRLDEIVPPDLFIGFIKIDVEGGELAALKGGETILQRCHPTILFECAKSGLKAHNVSQFEIYDFFDAHGYSLFLIKDWLAQNKPLNYEGFIKSMEYPFQAFNFLADLKN
ncbi:methyltransferase, FkbM family [Rivularia sp. PCC 7116]|uniref:FkbM family methyltransferase n=1 Tax=Rivularia sp. PCC 7116 TaxID=373994 RepID=UPI00029F35FB|nr:FkbM family methyltransferase [Rivularia sp. PCC 7116]AFY56269.1 methyltransferase, FkbM family [Rivularia sp. PCC 7116]